MVRRGQRSKRGGGSRRWFRRVVLVALGIGAWLLFQRTGPGAPPMDDIDEASRARLEQVLREAGGEGGSP